MEFGDSSLYQYEREKPGLYPGYWSYENLIYEAHSPTTDLKIAERNVEDHFAILKVGPALHYFRESIVCFE